MRSLITRLTGEEEPFLSDPDASRAATGAEHDPERLPRRRLWFTRPAAPVEGTGPTAPTTAQSTPSVRAQPTDQAAAPGGTGRAAPRPGGPGPSKLTYRLSRTWAKPGVRSGVTRYLPLALLGLLGWRLAADDEIRLAVEDRVADLSDRLAARPEFALTGVGIAGASDRLSAQIEETLALEPGTSSLRFDAEAARYALEGLGAVKSADVRLDPTGTVQVQVVERVPVALWRDSVGGLRFVDGDGVVFGRPSTRAKHGRLPLILGAGAPGEVAEALRLYASAPTLRPRIRAFVRVGERRWDVALERDITILLPGDDPEGALARALELDALERVLDADIAALDMRVGDRATLRLAPGAVETYQLRRKARTERGEDT